MIVIVVIMAMIAIAPAVQVVVLEIPDVAVGLIQLFDQLIVFVTGQAMFAAPIVSFLTANISLLIA
ncbi:MAG: hypothetical protein R3E89_13630 [Thiolinea sp.]